MVLFKKQVPEVAEKVVVDTVIGEVTGVKATTRRVTISMIDRNKPDFVFEGPWSGRDVLVVARSLNRAYRMLQRTQRRLMAANETSETLVV